jgi:hypothetical protein
MTSDSMAVLHHTHIEEMSRIQRDELAIMETGIEARNRAERMLRSMTKTTRMAKSPPCQRVVDHFLMERSIIAPDCRSE